MTLDVGIPTSISGHGWNSSDIPCQNRRISENAVHWWAVGWFLVGAGVRGTGSRPSRQSSLQAAWPRQERWWVVRAMHACPFVQCLMAVAE